MPDAADATAESGEVSYPVLKLKRNEDRRLAAGHLWVFSNEIDTVATPLVDFAPGTVVAVQSDRGKFLGYAYVNPHSLIAARILSRHQGFAPGQGLLVHRLNVALALRQRLYPRPYYRLVHGESDELPGLVVDRYGDTLVVQIGTAGMEAQKEWILAALDKVVKPANVIFKNDSAARELEGLPMYVEAARGVEPTEIEVQEGDCTFRAPLAAGQKTGWFFDQAANRRQFLGMLPKGGRVLDAFSYVGAWGVQAARAGADVTCVDSSATALEAATRNAERNGTTVRTQKADVFEALEELHGAREKFDTVIIDPPAFIKRRKDAGKGEAAYKRLNQLAMQLLPRDGLLISCSCSYHLEPDALLDAIQKAGRHLGRFVQVLASGGQAPDHPVHPAIRETRYLKAFLCRVTHD